MTPPTITIQATLSRDGLLELRQAIDALLEEVRDERTNPFTAKIMQRKADKKVGEVWGRVGDNIKRFLSQAAHDTGPGGEFTMNQMAEALGVDPKTVRSWHRNLGRTLRVVDAAIPEPPLLENRWDGTRNVYRFPEPIRVAILARDMG